MTDSLESVWSKAGQHQLVVGLAPLGSQGREWVWCSSVVLGSNPQWRPGYVAGANLRAVMPAALFLGPLM